MENFIGIMLAIINAIITIYITVAIIFFAIFWIRNYDVKITHYKDNKVEKPEGIKRILMYLLLAFTWPVSIYNGLRKK